MPTALHITVAGRVQGVGFRWVCRREARALGVTGWVRNRSDGAVEMHAEGAAEALDALQAWCREGPSGAVVRQVSATPATPTGASTFDIRLDED